MGEAWAAWTVRAGVVCSVCGIAVWWWGTGFGVMFEVLDEFSVSKTGREELNEDSYVVGEDVVAVFDGETNKGPREVPSPGRRAALVLREAVTELAGVYDPGFVVGRLHAAVAGLGGGVGVAASGAVFLGPVGKVVRVGDVSVGVGGVFDTPTRLAETAAACARAALLEAYLEAGWGVGELLDTDPGRDMVLPLLRAYRCWRNKGDSVWGFGVLDGSGTPEGLVDVFDVPEGCEVVLASDGYLDPGWCLEVSERRVRELVARDPLGIDPPRTKGVLSGHESFDDRTFVRVRVG